MHTYSYIHTPISLISRQTLGCQCAAQSSSSGGARETRATLHGVYARAPLCQTRKTCPAVTHRESTEVREITRVVFRGFPEKGVVSIEQASPNKRAISPLKLPSLNTDLY